MIEQVITPNSGCQSIYFENGADPIATLVVVFLCGNYLHIRDHKTLLKATIQNGELLIAMLI